ncbi:unnamed protein product, partial [Mesorhabditis belari]|uniref:C2H2-type domain-containing protein n=1 Tax=Mesorhabditis belari TaxID=2138241 RepID=A0AAF3F3I3_9BILA
MSGKSKTEDLEKPEPSMKETSKDPCSEKRVTCRKCDKDYLIKNQGDAIGHIENTHLHSRSFGCSDCDFTSVDEQKMRDHLTIEHRNFGDVIDQRTPEFLSERSRKLNFCFPEFGKLAAAPEDKLGVVKMADSKRSRRKSSISEESDDNIEKSHRIVERRSK